MKVFEGFSRRGKALASIFIASQAAVSGGGLGLLVWGAFHPWSISGFLAVIVGGALMGIGAGAIFGVVTYGTDESNVNTETTEETA